MSKINERQSFETNYATNGRRSEQRHIQRSIKQINYKKICQILLVVFAIFLLFSSINCGLKDKEKNQIIEKYEQNELKMKEEIQELKIENSSLQMQVEDEKNQLNLLFDKFMQTCFQEQKKAE